MVVVNRAQDRRTICSGEKKPKWFICYAVLLTPSDCVPKIARVLDMCVDFAGPPPDLFLNDAYRELG